jgi:hypothetical protein
VRGEAVRCERERVCDKMGIYIYIYIYIFYGDSRHDDVDTMKTIGKKLVLLFITREYFYFLK